MRKVFTLFFLFFTLIFNNYAFADAALVKRHDVQQFINKMVKENHFDKKQLVAILKEAQFQPKIIESMEKPYEKKTWDVYRDLFLAPWRAEEGVKFWQENHEALARAEREYNVPANIIVAIIGVETLYGKHQGTYRVIDALTTLAFNYPKRAPFFTKELGEYLLLCRELKIPADKYLGSYAGAIGKPQFMPSSYRYYAVDFTGNGRRDLVNNNADAIGSVANYFHKHGWKMNGAIAQPVKVNGAKYKKLATNSRGPDYTVNHLLSEGIETISPVMDRPNKAGLIELITQTGNEYWMAYPNFYVITRYNTSPQYALVVYLFSQELESKWAALQLNGASKSA